MPRAITPTLLEASVLPWLLAHNPELRQPVQFPVRWQRLEDGVAGSVLLGDCYIQLSDLNLSGSESALLPLTKNHDVQILTAGFRITLGKFQTLPRAWFSPGSVFPSQSWSQGTRKPEAHFACGSPHWLALARHAIGSAVVSAITLHVQLYLPGKFPCPSGFFHATVTALWAYMLPFHVHKCLQIPLCKTNLAHT